MTINLHFRVANLNVQAMDDRVIKQVLEVVQSLTKKIDTMGENTNKALSDLQAIQDSLAKVKTESAATLQKVTELQEAAANADTPQSVLDKIAEVAASVKAVDDLVPDATSETSTPTE